MAQNLAIEPRSSLGERWRCLAACRHVEVDLFFPVGSAGESSYEIAQAKQICFTCPVIDPCLEFALSTNQECGVWGGTTEEERRSLRRSWLKIRRETRMLVNDSGLGATTISFQNERARRESFDSIESQIAEYRGVS